MMDGYVFKKKTSNTRGQRTDRFVAPREYLGEMRRRRSWPSTCNHMDIWYSKYLQQKKYTMFLDNAFGLEAMPCQISDTQLEGHFSTTKRQGDIYQRPWPCVPRAKKFLMSADSILDLPSYSKAPFPELLDWSKDNVLVAALGSKYHKWSWDTQNLTNRGVTKHDIHCCKFDPKGEMLALGTEESIVEIHDNALNKRVGFGVCLCSSVFSCAVTALDWSPTGKSYAIISPDARYVAVSALSQSIINLFTWPSLEPYSVLGCCNWTIRSLTWHPWRSALLGVGAVTSNINARVALCNAPTASLREYSLSCKRYYLDSMLFSHRTGELVVSLWNPDEKAAQLVVMSDPDTAVDNWGELQKYLDRVRHMVFSPDGTKLATATAEEDLIMWNFLPEDNLYKKKTIRRRFSNMPVFLDETSKDFSLR